MCVLDGQNLLDPGAEPLVQRLIDRENELIEQEAFAAPLFAVIVGRRS